MIDLQHESHILVNVDTDIADEQHAVFFPSKILEYIAANRRILNIGNRHSVSYELVQDKFGDCVEFGSAENLKTLLFQYWNKYKHEDAEFFTSKNTGEQYAAHINAKKLFDEMKSLTHYNDNATEQSLQ
jgi:hypothetical protein